MCWSFFENPGTGKWIRGCLNIHTRGDWRPSGTKFCHAGIFQNFYDLVAALLVPGVISRFIPRRGEIGEHDAQSLSADYYYLIFASPGIFWIEKEKPHIVLMEKEALKQQLKEQIIEFLNLMDVKPEDIKDDQPIFGSGLGLDSIDAIELIVLLERKYGIKINDPKEGRKILIDINTIVDYIEVNRTK
jgi:acyl carrier protein